MTFKRTLQPQLGSVLCMLPVRWNVLLKEVKIVSMVEVVDVDGALFQSCSWNGWLDHGRRCQVLEFGMPRDDWITRTRRARVLIERRNRPTACY